MNVSFSDKKTGNQFGNVYQFVKVLGGIGNDVKN